LLFNLLLIAVRRLLLCCVVVVQEVDQKLDGVTTDDEKHHNELLQKSWSNFRQVLEDVQLHPIIDRSSKRIQTLFEPHSQYT
jgi:hypothetical protein